MHEARRVEQDVDLADAFCHFADGGTVAHVKPRHPDTPSLASARDRFVRCQCKNRAPSRAKAMAQARPIPAAPAVTNARFALQAVSHSDLLIVRPNR